MLSNRRLIVKRRNRFLIRVSRFSIPFARIGIVCQILIGRTNKIDSTIGRSHVDTCNLIFGDDDGNKFFVDSTDVVNFCVVFCFSFVNFQLTFVIIDDFPKNCTESEYVIRRFDINIVE